jgi:hypothetical protein
LLARSAKRKTKQHHETNSRAVQHIGPTTKRQQSRARRSQPITVLERCGARECGGDAPCSHPPQELGHLKHTAHAYQQFCGPSRYQAPSGQARSGRSTTPRRPNKNQVSTPFCTTDTHAFQPRCVQHGQLRIGATPSVLTGSSPTASSTPALAAPPLRYHPRAATAAATTAWPRSAQPRYSPSEQLRRDSSTTMRR